MKKLKSILPDAMIVLGAAFIGYGAFLLHTAAGYLVTGALLILLAQAAAKGVDEG